MCVSIIWEEVGRGEREWRKPNGAAKNPGRRMQDEEREELSACVCVCAAYPCRGKAPLLLQ